MTDKEQVIRIYPCARLLRNTQQWCDPENFILVKNIPQRLLQDLENDTINVDKWFSWPSKMIPLSKWSETEDACWSNAWGQIQRDMIETLES